MVTRREEPRAKPFVLGWSWFKSRPPKPYNKVRTRKFWDKEALKEKYKQPDEVVEEKKEFTKAQEYLRFYYDNPPK